MGRKTREWKKAKSRRIKEDLASGIVEMVDGAIHGICKECGHWHAVTLDHEIKRSQGGGHGKDNTGWICSTPPCNCHDRVDNMAGSRKNKDKKPDWMKSHKCVSCGFISGMLICPNCGKQSLKSKEVTK